MEKRYPTEVPGTTSSEPLLPFWLRPVGRFLCQLSARLPLLLLASVTWLRCVCQLSPQCSLSFPLSPAVALEGSLCQFTFKESGLMIPFLEGGGCLHNCLGILLYGILIHSSIFTYSVRILRYFENLNLALLSFYQSVMKFRWKMGSNYFQVLSSIHLFI